MSSEKFYRILGELFSAYDHEEHGKLGDLLKEFDKDELMRAIGLLGQVQEIAWHAYRVRGKGIER